MDRNSASSAGTRRLLICQWAVWLTTTHRNLLEGYFRCYSDVDIHFVKPFILLVWNQVKKSNDNVCVSSLYHLKCPSKRLLFVDVPMLIGMYKVDPSIYLSATSLFFLFFSTWSFPVVKVASSDHCFLPVGQAPCVPCWQNAIALQERFPHQPWLCC